MKITYDHDKETYQVVICEPDTTFLFNTDDIVEVRGELIKCVTSLFNDAVCEKFKENTICQSDDNHEWECYAMSSTGCSYRCKKCDKYKFTPYTSSTTNGDE